MTATVTRILCYFGYLTLSLGMITLTHAATYQLSSRGDDIIGKPTHITTKYTDTLISVARHHNLGYREIRIANPGVDPWLPGENTKVVLPTHFILPDAPRKGIVINIAEMRLYYYPKSSANKKTTVLTVPISIGRGDWQTPLGKTRIIQKVRNPSWYPPKSIRQEHADRGDVLEKVVPPGPDNPLGKYALKLGLPGYLIHGTNKPSGIGMQVTHGCIRLFPEDIESLYKIVPMGTPVRIINQRYKAGWMGDRLYLEVHPVIEEGTAESQNSKDLTPVVKSIITATKNKPEFPIDWKLIREIAAHPKGFPILVGSQITPNSDDAVPSSHHLAME